jgi:Holliday junction resolvase RusA-like endonuclease
VTCIRFSVPGEPVGKARPRFTKNGHAYTPDKTRSYEAIVRLCAIKAMKGKKLLTGAISLTVTAFFPMPKYFTKAIREKALSGELLHQKKPDWDNVGKIISDALNGVVYADDATVSRASVSKRYSDFPRVEVSVELCGE